jgi:hypothetical protein
MPVRAQARVRRAYHNRTHILCWKDQVSAEHLRRSGLEILVEDEVDRATGPASVRGKGEKHSK